MSMEESSEAGVAPVASAEAPASEAPASSESMGTSLPVESEVATPVSDSSGPDAFAWDAWDGEVEGLPEEARSWGTPIQRHYSKWADSQIEQRVTDIEGLKELYESLLSGKEDPRIAQHKTDIEGWEKKHGDAVSGWESKYGELETAYGQFQTNVEKALDQEANDYAQWFQEENKDIFEDERLANVFVGLLEEEWDMETAAQASRLPAPMLQAARQAKADGVPDSYALRLAGRVASPAAPRPGAKITSGATAPAGSREQTMLPDKHQPTSFKDLRNQVARSALKRSN